MIAGAALETCREVAMTLGVKKLSHEQPSFYTCLVRRKACMLGYVYMHYICIYARAISLETLVSLRFVH
jgi:hypothetical protein